VVPFVRVAAAEPRGMRTPAPPAPERSIRVRTFPPGSDWLYAKLYTGTATADRVLVDMVGPVVRELLGRGLADGWFFIRYGDPRWHVRLRLHGEPSVLWAEGLPLLHAAAAPLLDDGRLWRIQLGTYEREVERYGGDEGIVLSEALFQHDSEAVLAIVETLWGDEGLDARWRLALCGIDRLLTDLELSPLQKLTWARQAGKSMAVSVRADRRVRGEIGEKFRAERRALEALLAVEQEDGEWLRPGVESLRARSARLAPISKCLRQLEGSGRLDVGVPDLVASYAHMHANRLLRSAHQTQEMVLYEFLERIYASRLARSGR
jgi:thiopeptide-type bacteriocin biosynthesis protein